LIRNFRKDEKGSDKLMTLSVENAPNVTETNVFSAFKVTHSQTNPGDPSCPPKPTAIEFEYFNQTELLRGAGPHYSFSRRFVLPYCAARDYPSLLRFDMHYVQVSEAGHSQPRPVPATPSSSSGSDSDTDSASSSSGSDPTLDDSTHSRPTSTAPPTRSTAKAALSSKVSSS
jgi:hypothetical protein